MGLVLNLILRLGECIPPNRELFYPAMIWDRTIVINGSILVTTDLYIYHRIGLSSEGLTCSGWYERRDSDQTLTACSIWVIVLINSAWCFSNPVVCPHCLVVLHHCTQESMPTFASAFAVGYGRCIDFLSLCLYSMSMSCAPTHNEPKVLLSKIKEGVMQWKLLRAKWERFSLSWLNMVNFYPSLQNFKWNHIYRLQNPPLTSTPPIATDGWQHGSSLEQSRLECAVATQ